MTIQQTLHELLDVEARSKALDQRKTELRQILDDDLRARWEAEGIASSLRAPGLGTVSLSGCDSTSTEVTDPDAYTEWAQENHPDLVRTVTLVETSLLAALGKGGATLDGKLITGDGVIVPGVEVRQKRPWLMVKLDPQAKARALAELQPVSVSEEVS